MTDTEPQGETCPLPLDSLPPQVRKHVEPGAKEKMRKMAARGIIPMPPADQVKALCILSYDPDPAIRETALETVRGLPEKVFSSVLRGSLPPPVLDFLAQHLSDKPAYVELILLNQQTSDETVARLARTVEEKALTIIAENQLRLLRHPDIIRGIHENPHASQALLDRVVDFAVRSGLDIPDLETFQEARRRIFGDSAPPADTSGDTAESLLEEHSEELASESAEAFDVEAEEEASEERLTLTQKILKMTVSEKIKLATLGNKAARSILLRDSNKLVQLAAVTSPRITEGEVIGLTNSRTLSDDVMRVILSNRDWMKNYQVKVNLVNNPKTPVPDAMRLLQHLRVSDLKQLARNRNISNVVRTQAKNLLQKKGVN